MTGTPDPEEIARGIIGRSLLAAVGSEVVAIIRARTLKGEFLAGSSPNASRYSTTPMPLPFGALPKTAQSRVRQLIKAKDPDVDLFLSKRKTLWLRLAGGYKQFRELAGLQTSVVNLNWSGRMMRNLAVTNITSDTVQIGFTSPEEAQKALWHNRLGAGKSHRKHVFLGLSPKEVDRIARVISGHLGGGG